MSAKALRVIDHVQGPLRGSRQVLMGAHLGIGTGEGAFVHFPTHGVLDVLARHAILKKDGDSYQIVAENGALVSVNGDQVDEQILKHGDLIRLGVNGPLLRYRDLDPASSAAFSDSEARLFKPMKDVLDDCLEGAKSETTTNIGLGLKMLSYLPKDIATQTSPLVRIMSVFVFVVVIVFLAIMSARLADLESQLDVQTAEVTERLGLLEQDGRITVDELRQIRSEIVLASDQLSLLSSGSGEEARIIQRVVQSIVFVQASYGFKDSSGVMLRAVVGLDGKRILDSRGHMMLTIRGKGPLIERQYTGTAFMASSDGLLITNHHVAEPWLFDEGAKVAIANGYSPVMIRMIGYLPNSEEPFDVSMVEASSSADLAVLRRSGVSQKVPVLELSEKEPELGQSVLLLGYPTGIRALLARSNPAFVDSLLRSSPEPDFWQIVQNLAGNGHVAPLVTRGIIGQITPSAIVYDAETTHGGSGGPVIGLDGRVLAINSRIISDFGGSNMGVPAKAARDLIRPHLKLVNR